MFNLESVISANLDRVLAVIKWALRTEMIDAVARGQLVELQEHIEKVRLALLNLGEAEAELWTKEQVAIHTGLHPNSVSNFKDAVWLHHTGRTALYDPADFKSARPRRKRRSKGVRFSPGKSRGVAGSRREKGPGR